MCNILNPFAWSQTYMLIYCLVSFLNVTMFQTFLKTIKTHLNLQMCHLNLILFHSFNQFSIRNLLDYFSNYLVNYHGSNSTKHVNTSIMLIVSNFCLSCRFLYLSYHHNDKKYIKQKGREWHVTLSSLLFKIFFNILLFQVFLLY